METTKAYLDAALAVILCVVGTICMIPFFIFSIPVSWIAGYFGYNVNISLSRRG